MEIIIISRIENEDIEPQITQELKLEFLLDAKQE